MLQFFALLLTIRSHGMNQSQFRRLGNAPHLWKRGGKAIHLLQMCLEHYATCSVFWKFVAAPVPQGLGIPSSLRSREAFFLLHDRLDEQSRVKLALGIYSLQRLVMTCRTGPGGANLNHQVLLRIWTKRAAMGSRSRVLLCASSSHL